MLSRLLVFLFLFISLSGCAARSSLTWTSITPYSGQKDHTAELDDWNNLQELRQNTRVAVYLEDGRRTVQNFRGSTDSQVLLDVAAVERDSIAAIIVVPEDRQLNGVLIGSGIGAAFAFAITAPESDFTSGGIAMFSLMGAGAGAGIGALLDAGITTPEKPIYMRKNLEPEATSKHWKLNIDAAAVHGWVLKREVQLMLRDGTYFKGKVVRGDAQNIQLAVKDSSEESFKNREIGISPDRISTIIYRENLGGNSLASSMGGGIAGGLIGLMTGATISGAANEGLGAAVAGSLGAAGGTITGFALAEHYNWREVTLVVK